MYHDVEKSPPCKRCGKVEIEFENILCFNLTQKYLNILITEKEVNTQAIESVLIAENIPDNTKAFITKSLLIFLQEIRNTIIRGKNG